MLVNGSMPFCRFVKQLKCFELEDFCIGIYHLDFETNRLEFEFLFFLCNFSTLRNVFVYCQ